MPQTFGSMAKWNPHVHALVPMTAGTGSNPASQERCVLMRCLRHLSVILGIDRAEWQVVSSVQVEKSKYKGREVLCWE